MSSPTGNPYVDSISWGDAKFKAAPGKPLVIKYHFDNKYSTWTKAEKKAFKFALKAFSEVADISFRAVKKKSNADLVEYSLSNKKIKQVLDVPKGYIAFGEHKTPDKKGPLRGYFNNQAYSFPSDGISNKKAGLKEGGFGFLTFLHELGHALGLAHPHDRGGGSNIMPGIRTSSGYGDPTDTSPYSSTIHTVMSYNGGMVDKVGIRGSTQDPEENGQSRKGYNTNLAPLDIAAIQAKYGAKADANLGDNVYDLTQGAWKSIWDTGGTDEIRYTGGLDVVIALGSATWSATGNPSGFLSYIVSGSGDANKHYGGLTIAADFTNAIADQNGETGVLIENATGGSGDDWITGNRLDNILIGNAGDDRITLVSGNDQAFGGPGRDTFILGSGQFTVHGDEDDDTFLFGQLSDATAGGLIFGGEGLDTISPAAAAPDLSGVRVDSVERVFVASAQATTLNFDVATIQHFMDQGISFVGGEAATIQTTMGSETSLDLTGLDVSGWLSTSVPVQIVGDDDDETVTGSNAGDFFDLKGGNNIAYGGLGGDTFKLGAGSTDAYGEVGDDFFVFDALTSFTNSHVYGGQGTDTLQFAANGYYHTSTFDLSGLQVDSVERLYVDIYQTRLLKFDASTIQRFAAAGMSFEGGKYSAIEVSLGTDTNVDLSGLDVTNWDFSEKSIEIHGDTDAETIVGSNGSDLIFGGGGLDNLNGGFGDDSFSFFATDFGAATIDGGEGADKITLDCSEDTNFDLRGIDIGSIEQVYVLNRYPAAVTVELEAAQFGATGFSEDLSIRASFSRNVSLTIHVGPNETIDASGLQFLSWSFGGGVTFIGSEGKETIVATAEDDVIEGRGDDDILSGGNGNDDVSGGAGDDELSGGEGADLIVGGEGDDSLTGGQGYDRFLFAANEGSDTIFDFQIGVDRLDLKAFSFSSSGEALSHFSELGTANDDMVLFSFSGTTITIHGLDWGDIDQLNLMI
ncbi:MAG: M10 family metallopeptidase C-terminal domain-containing protein [Hyphomicrobiaceae bacterium]|nr:M10 family metallopeptidase C-terminal domain-containing protein [Hyphomicrobiaceae bacterium]